MASKATSAALDTLYQQLKELDSTITSSRQQASKIRLTEWEREPGQNPRFEEFKAIREELLGNLASISRIAEDLQTSLRENVNTLSRPTLRPLHILDLPDEILIKISGYVKGWEPDESYLTPHSQGVPDVKNLRLTCRRFCNASSHLLLHYLCVELTPISLARFEEISRHPEIRKGVRAVRILLHFYDSVLAQDIGIFARYCADKLNETHEFMERLGSDSMEMFQRSEETVQQALNISQVIFESWDSFDQGTTDDSVDQELLRYRIILRDAHEKFQRCFAEQETLRKDGSFIRTVAAAIARMPIARRLDFVDEDFFFNQRRVSYFDRTNDTEALERSILLPIEWEEARIHRLGNPPTEILVQLLGAVHKAGVSLNNIEIKVSPPEDYSALVPNDEDLHAITSAVQNLKSFSFRFRGEEQGLWPAREQVEVKHLVKFLRSILDTASIQDIDLDLDFLWDGENPPLFSLSPIITQRPWKNLESFSCSGVPLHLAELERFVDQISPATITLTITSTHLLSGTWAEALDVLRRKSTHFWSIESPSGAECDAMSDEEKNAVFGRSPTWYDDWSLADQYLRGEIDNNPLRANGGGEN